MRAPRPRPAVLLAAVAAAAAGCYRHVVRTEGYGTGTTDVYESNLPDEPGPVEDLIFGPSEPQKQKRPR